MRILAGISLLVELISRKDGLIKELGKSNLKFNSKNTQETSAMDKLTP